MPDEPESLLHWKAFLYISGDLSAEESLDFERLLLEDQSARDAVASAVLLVEAVVAIGAEDRARTLALRRNRRRSLTKLVGLTAAASLLASILILNLRPHSKVESDGSAVALTWSGIRKGIDAEWSTLVAGSQVADATDSTLATEGDEPTDPSTERPLPSWLLAAASTPESDAAKGEN